MAMFRKQDFKKVDLLGSGKKNTKIYKAEHIPTGKYYALKEVEAADEAEQMNDIAGKARLALDKDRAKVEVTTLAEFKNSAHPGSLDAAAGELFEVSSAVRRCTHCSMF